MQFFHLGHTFNISLFGILYSIFWLWLLLLFVISHRFNIIHLRCIHKPTSLSTDSVLSVMCSEVYIIVIIIIIIFNSCEMKSFNRRTMRWPHVHTVCLCVRQCTRVCESTTYNKCLKQAQPVGRHT